LAKGITSNEIGIIASSNSQIRQMAGFLQAEKIPFFIVSWRFKNSAVVVWLQECAAWCTDRDSQSFNELFRFWNRLLNNHNDSRKNLELIQLKTLFYAILVNSAGSKNTFEWISYLVAQLGLNNTLVDSEIYPNEVENIEELLEEANLHNLKNASIQRFANLGFPENEVTITTRHSSKGLEFEAVILLGMEEGNFPDYRHSNNPSALAEDQRICYVCISRAKKTCILIRSEIISIPKRNGGIWRKPFTASRYWISLHKRFGNDENTFTNITYA
jgi:DNA helicase-2/ATP-dependent DNA helicase PcrA